MDDALTIAATGMSAVERMLENSAHNAVNAGTPGYQRHRVTLQNFGAVLDDAASNRHLVTTSESVSFEQGNFRHSDSPFSMALEGTAFFTVAGPDGKHYFTRNGDFVAGSDGTLRTQSGLGVIGASGNTIQVDPLRGPIAVSKGGALSQRGAEIAQLALVEFEPVAQAQLTKAGETLFQAAPGTTPDAATSTSVHQGALEVPRFNGAMGLVGMLLASRNFDSMQRALRSINESHQ